MNSTVQDRFGREVRYLRISVTDRCNFRCKYCMPSDEFKHLEHSSILRFEDMLFVTEVFASLGVHKVRVTGGEPLVRKGVTDFLRELHKIEGIDEVTLTTNGALLGKYAEEIAASGVKRINVSLDSLKAEKYKEITGGFDIQKLMESIFLAKKAGLRPVKTNSVLIRGFNDCEIYDFCEFAARADIVVRFIEFMPIGNSCEWKKENIMYGAEILDLISKRYKVTPVGRDKNAGPAKNYQLSNGATIGIITPISNHFCSECDKLRLTADGKIRPCLLTDKETDIVDAVRSRDKDALRAAIMDALGKKDEEHHIVADSRNERFKRTMSKIGG
ncbi:GTP 3',8-cyclase MoaA [Geovibrio ferrireducens]|uniref:GTP 3',8-cyclase MoaA n=1 Tax=Geovibrio ferrireducens TaxID=46201 RepID=UPI0022479196|nr:GTP 3',8-cyclase MoaA [Geovibrio ferrireducens]